MRVYGRRYDATNGRVNVFVYDTAGAVEVSGGTNVATGAANIWTQTSVSSSFAGTYTAGSYMTIQIDMVADANDNVKVGEIDMNYFANN